MELKPFIGLLGVQTVGERAELSRIAGAFAGRPHRLLLGTYADGKTLMGSQPRLFRPARETLASLCEKSGNVAHAVHYTPHPDQHLAEQLATLMTLCPDLDVLILHVPWPDQRLVEMFRSLWPKVSFVLWVSEECFLDLGENTTRVAERIAEYVRGGLADGVMLDLAAGKGAPVDQAKAVHVLRQMRRTGVSIPFGLAGGLSAERFDEGLSGIVREFNPLSLVASRHIRHGGRIDPILARQFADRALLASDDKTIRT